MKKNYSISVFLVLFIFMANHRSFSQEVMVILNVNTDKINRSNTDAVSNFGQNTDEVSNRDFTIFVNEGDTVEWSGVSSNAPDRDQVLIKSINHEGGDRVFGRNVLRQAVSGSGIVSGVVSEGKRGKEEKYTISFRVVRNGEQIPGLFKIDPKIKVQD